MAQGYFAYIRGPSHYLLRPGNAEVLDGRIHRSCGNRPGRFTVARRGEFNQVGCEGLYCGIDLGVRADTRKQLGERQLSYRTNVLAEYVLLVVQPIAPEYAVLHRLPAPECCSQIQGCRRLS